MTAAILCLLAGQSTAWPGNAQPSGFDLQAHRGGRGETTEESLRGFAKSIELGVTTLELDVVLTRDRHPLVWHDPGIEPAKCGDTAPVVAGDPQFPYVGKPVRDLSLAQLRTLRCDKALPEHPDAEVVPGNTVATLDQVFALADSYPAGVRFNIETKVDGADPQQIVDVVLSSVRAAGKLGLVEIQSFDWRTLPLVRAAEPMVPLVALWDGTTWTPGSPWLAGIDPAVVPDPVTAARMVGADVVAPEYRSVDAELVSRAHALGLKVVSWTVNDAEAMRAQIGLGLDGFITDYPALGRAVLAGLGMALPPAYRHG